MRFGVCHQGVCATRQSAASCSAAVAAVQVSGYRAGHGRSRSGVVGRSGGGAKHAVPFFYPDNGTGAVGGARFARNRPSRPGWMAWSERRSSVPCPSRLGWASSAITRSKARDGSSPTWRGASTPASPGSSRGIQAGNHGVSSRARQLAPEPRATHSAAINPESPKRRSAARTPEARDDTERTTIRWPWHGRAASNGPARAGRASRTGLLS